jgi:hypothetical protein
MIPSIPSTSGCATILPITARIQIEDDDRSISAAVADETPAHFGDDSNSMGYFLSGDIAEDLAGLRIDHHRVRASRNK